MNKYLPIALLLANASAKKAVDTQKMVSIVEGVLAGALNAEGFDDINTCIKDAETVIQDAQVAVQDFEAGGLDNVIEGVKEVAEILKVVKAGMSDCSHLKADWERLEAMAAIFDSPTSFAYHVGKDLLINGRDIYSEINTAITDYSAKNWQGFGYNVGEAAAKVILGDISQKEIKFAQIMKGAMKSFGGSFNVEALLICIYEEDQAALALDNAVKEAIKFYHDRDVNDLIPAVMLTVIAYQQALKGLPACEAIDSSLWSAESFNTAQNNILAKPTEVFEVKENDVLLNGTGVASYIIEAVEAYQAGQFEKFGEIMGDVAKLAESKVVATPEPEVSKEDVAKFAQGMLKSMGVGAFNLEALLICVYEEDQAALILYEGVQIIKEAIANKDISEAIGGVIAAVAFVQQFKQGLPACEAIDASAADWTQFNKLVEVVEDPAAHMRVIGKDLFMNGRAITKDVAQAFDDFRSGDFEKFGEDLGSALVSVTKPNIEKKEIAEFIQGFYKGMDVGAFNLEALLICVYEEDQAALIVYEAVEMIEDVIKTKDYEELIGVAIATVAAFQQFKQGLPACEAIDASAANWTKYNQATSMIENHKIKAIGKNIMMNGKNITKDMENVVANYQAGKFEQMGESLADAFSAATAPAISKMEKKEMAEFLQGFYKAMGVGSINVEALLICIYEEDQAALIMYEAVEMIEDVIATKDYEELIGVAIATVAGFQQFKQGLPACEAIDSSALNWTKYNEATTMVENHNIKTIGKNIIMNGKNITKDIDAFVANYQAGQFEQMGESLGDAFAVATAPAAKEAITKTQMAEMLHGYFKIMGLGDFNVEALLICIYEEDQAALILYEDVQMIEDVIATKDYEELIGVAIATVAAFQQFKQGLPACEAIDTSASDFYKIDQAKTIVTGEATKVRMVGKDVVLNGRIITDEIMTAIDAFKAGNYEQFGEDMGTAMMKASEQSAFSHMKKEQIAKVLKGFLEQTMVGSFNLEALLICVYEEDQAALILYEGVQIFK
jgi:hypothetical protein